MKNERHRWVSRLGAAALGLLVMAPAGLVAQGPGLENGQWTYLGGDAPAA